MNTDQQSSRKLVTALLVVGIVLRLVGLSVHSLWIDEAGTIYVAQAGDVAAALRADRHPPLSFWLFRTWMMVFGESDAWLRLAPALASIASLFLLAKLAREWLDERSVWIAVAITAVSPLELWIAHEVRMYAFVECAALVALVAAWSHLKESRVLRLGIVFLASGAATGLHYFGAFVGVSVALLAGLVLLAGGAGRRDAFAIAAAGVLGALTWTPWFMSVYGHQAAVDASFLSHFGARAVTELPARLIVPTTNMLPQWATFSAYAAAGGVTLAFALFVWQFVRERRLRDSAIAIVFATPPLSALAVAIVGPLNFLARYFVASVPGVVLATARGIGSLQSRALRVGFALTLVSLLAMIDVALHAKNAREDWRGACAQVAQDFRPGDRVISVTHLTDPYSQAPLRHYWRDRPDLLAALTTFKETQENRPSSASGSRLHMIYRETRYAEALYKDLTTRFHVVEKTALHGAIYRLILE